MPEIFAPRTLLRVEGAALLALSVYLFVTIDGGWLLFAVLLQAPDLGMAGYARGMRVGAVAYNLLHTEVLPAARALAGLALPNGTALSLALIWFARIGLDRLLGFGLKYPTAFRDTHLGRV